MTSNHINCRWVFERIWGHQDAGQTTRRKIYYYSTSMRLDPGCNETSTTRTIIEPILSFHSLVVQNTFVFQTIHFIDGCPEIATNFPRFKMRLFPRHTLSSFVAFCTTRASSSTDEFLNVFDDKETTIQAKHLMRKTSHLL